MNENEKRLETTLKGLRSQKKWIELQLRPDIGTTTISKEPINIAVINEGRHGKFYNISESFYDLMVDKFDSRYRK